MTNEIQQYEQQLKNYESELKKAEERIQKKEETVNQYIGQIYGQGGKQNLVEWELDFKPELEDISHTLRCDLVEIKDGDQKWISNPDSTKVFMNELGVNDVLRTIIMLVNKNKVLSNYTIEEIKDRVRMVGHEIRTLIYNNYEKYGIDNDYKMNNYSGMVLYIISVIEDAYRRAMSGETHKGLAEQRLVTQNEPLYHNQQMIMSPKQKASWYNPSSWGN